MDESRAVKLLSEALRWEPVETDEEYQFTPRHRGDDFRVSISKVDLASIVTALNEKSRHESLWLYDDTTMELLAREENPGPVGRLRGEEININIRDEDNGVQYEITSPSDEYILFFLDAISDHPDARYFLRGW